MKRTLAFIISILMIILLTPSAGSADVGDPILIGDVDGDGEITAQDANCITRYLASFEFLDASQLSRADMDGDGQVTSYDASLILSSVVVPEVRNAPQWTFSAILTSDMKGEAWGSNTEYSNGTCSALNLVTFIEEQREKDPDILLIDAGGSLFGSAISDEYQNFTEKNYGPMTRIFRAMEYDAVMLGPEALVYRSHLIRNEVDSLVAAKIHVFGTNLTKSYPLLNDSEYAPWNDLEQYTVLELGQESGKTIRIGLIGIVQQNLAQSTDEVTAADPIPCFDRIRSKMKESKCDVNLLIYYGNAEDDESRPENGSLRGLLRQISDIDMVLVAHGAGESIRTGHDGYGNDIPIVSLPDGVESACKLTVARRENGAIVFRKETFDIRKYPPEPNTTKRIHSYVTAISEMMDARVGTIKQKIEAFSDDTVAMTDGMELVHDMQTWFAKKWISESGLDLPPNLISIAYPYLGTSEWEEGPIRYRDLCALDFQTPRYTLMMIRGSELRAWLSDYTGEIRKGGPIYSLHGLSYLLNTMNPENPLGYLEYSSGISVDDDEVFTLILADDPESETILRPYLDETWMTYEDRVISDFTLPRPNRIVVSDAYKQLDCVTAFFEAVGEYKVNRETSWLVI